MTADMDAGGPPLLEIRGLRKEYPAVTALDGVDLTVGRGEFHGLLGENGAGKSTLIKIVTGVQRGDAGELRWNGEPVDLRSPADAMALGISVIPQQLVLLRRKSVTENVMLGLGHSHSAGWIDGAEGRRRTEEALARLSVEADPRAPMGTLPLHKQRMIMIAIAMARDARLVIMDEPTASLNADEIAVLHSALTALVDSGVSLLYVTHRLAEVADIDRVTVLRNGRVVLAAPGRDVTADDLVTAIAGRHLGDADTPTAAPADESEDALLELRELSSDSLRAVSCRIPAGRITGVTGAEGSGIKDLGRLLYGMLPSTGGEVRFRGRPYAPKGPRGAMREGLVYLAQDRAKTGVFSRKTIRENCAMGPYSVGRFRKRPGRRDTAALRDATTDMMRKLSIAAPSDLAPVSSLSGGNQQKVLLARALLCEPDLLVLEEPTEGVDVGARREFFDTLRTVAAEGRAAVVVSSDWEELAEVCDSILVMRSGEIVGELHGEDINPQRLARLALGAT